MPTFILYCYALLGDTEAKKIWWQEPASPSKSKGRVPWQHRLATPLWCTKPRWVRNKNLVVGKNVRKHKMIASIDPILSQQEKEGAPNQIMPGL